MTITLKHILILSSLSLLISSCWSDEGQSEKEGKKLDKIDSVKTKRGQILKDTFTDLNIQAQDIYFQTFINEHRITVGDSLYLNCGYVDPTHAEFTCSLKQNLPDGVYNVYSDSNFLTLKFRFEFKRSLPLLSMRVYYKDGTLAKYSEFNNVMSEKSLIVSYKRNGIIGRIMLFVKGKLIVSKEYDESGNLIRLFVRP